MGRRGCPIQGCDGTGEVCTPADCPYLLRHENAVLQAALDKMRALCGDEYRFKDGAQSWWASQVRAILDGPIPEACRSEWHGEGECPIGISHPPIPHPEPAGAPPREALREMQAGIQRSADQMRRAVVEINRSIEQIRRINAQQAQIRFLARRAGLIEILRQVVGDGPIGSNTVIAIGDQLILQYGRDVINAACAELGLIWTPGGSGPETWQVSGGGTT